MFPTYIITFVHRYLVITNFTTSLMLSVSRVQCKGGITSIWQCAKLFLSLLFTLRLFERILPKKSRRKTYFSVSGRGLNTLPTELQWRLYIIDSSNPLVRKTIHFSWHVVYVVTWFEKLFMAILATVKGFYQRIVQRNSQKYFFFF